MRVRYSPRAGEDLENIRRYIGKSSQPSAWVVASFIRQLSIGAGSSPLVLPHLPMLPAGGAVGGAE
jgi:hypothetical protein